jgi:hypothetical protein
MELIRLLLLGAERDADVSEALKRYPEPQQVYHLTLLKDAGYLDVAIIDDQNGFPAGAAVIRLTWQGHEFLDLTRDEKVWAFVKKKILKPGVSWTTSILIEALKAEANGVSVHEFLRVLKRNPKPVSSFFPSRLARVTSPRHEMRVGARWGLNHH